MRRSRVRPRRSGCPIGIALDVLGDPWTLLVVRDLMFKGLTTFNEFLNAGEGIATNILSDRLARLEAADIVSHRPDTADARRTVYRLTRKGIDLAPVMVELVLWADRYEDTAAPAHEVKAMREQRDAVLADVRRRWRSARTGARR
jgi:DNA-binding HxlR family transcriptional regulator